MINGAVFKSAGLAINWRVPTSGEDDKYKQAVKWTYKCGECGRIGQQVEMPDVCPIPSCGGHLESKRQYLIPQGFTVDYYAPTHNDISPVSFSPLEDPQVSFDESHSAWTTFSDVRLGSYRQSSVVDMFLENKGAFGRGFAVCMRCGRSEPMPEAEGEQSNIEREARHDRLHRSSNRSRVCSTHNGKSIISK